jgi:hypothetical protein
MELANYYLSFRANSRVVSMEKCLRTSSSISVTLSGVEGSSQNSQSPLTLIIFNKHYQYYKVYELWASTTLSLTKHFEQLCVKIKTGLFMSFKGQAK